MFYCEDSELSPEVIQTGINIFFHNITMNLSSISL